MIARIELTDYRVFEHFVMHPKALNVLSGDNAEGKSTIIMALQEFFEGGHNPDQIRNGATKAELLLVLDNGDTFRKVIRRKGYELTGESKDSTPIPSPATHLKNLASGFGFDPLALIRAKPKERAAFLVEALGLEFTPAEILPLVSPTGLTLISAKDKPVDPDGLAKIRKQIYETRTLVNGKADQAESTAVTLEKSLAPDDGTDWSAAIKASEAELAKVRASMTADVDTIRKKADELRRQIQGKRDADIEAIRREMEAQIQTIRDVAANDEAELNTEVTRLSDERKATSQADIEKLTAEITSARDHADAMLRNSQTRKVIAAQRAAQREAEAKADVLTHAIDALDALKKQKLDSLPIDGVEMKDGDIYRDGVAFDRLNTGNQYITAFELATLKPNPLGLIIGDKFESVGPKNWPLFRDAALNSGWQVFVTRVEAGPLNVESIAAPDEVTA